MNLRSGCGDILRDDRTSGGRRRVEASERSVATEEVSTALAEDDDLDLIRRVAAQDRQAFEALYRRYAPRLHGYLWKLLRRREVVEEVLDDVMVVVWKGSRKFNFTSRLSTWIFGIAHNMALKAFRKYPRSRRGSPRRRRR